MKLERSQRNRLINAGQEFLLEHLAALDDAQQEALLAQLADLDLDLVARLGKGEGLARPLRGEWEPLPYVPADERGPAGGAWRRGETDLRKGRVAFALLAGGQASRLQGEGPKGTVPIGPRTERSLFQVLVERIVRAQRDYRRKIPLAVTTSATTDAASRAFFEANDCFGLDRDRLRFACQASLPALDEEGRLVLAAPDRVFVSPDGHGGAVQILETEGILKAWQEAGVETVCTFQVDNPLLPVVDPDLIGRVAGGKAPIATKVVAKTHPDERLGVVVRVGGRPAIVEYSEISAERASARDPDGRLTYRLGSIAVHAFRLDFLREALETGLPLHRARKEIPVLDAEGNAHRRWGLKHERFLFDLFPRTEDLTVVEVLREREYAPVKNAEGPESPATCCAALEREYRRWYEEAGQQPPKGEPLELSPLDAIGPDDLQADG